MTPVEALERVVYFLDRAHDNGFKAKAFVRALDTARATSVDELVERSKAGTLTKLEGIGDSTAKVITEALDGKEPEYLAKMDEQTKVKITEAGARYRQALRGDCHLHSRWSDGGATIEAMARTAMALGHEYMVLTDHSPRLTIAHGLSPERLEQQLADVATLNEQLAPFRILSGIEVDILEDGTLDHTDDVLSQLDIVVASVHSKLRMDRDLMTERMVRAIANPHVDILGHCTGRLIGERPESQFDPDYVFAACKQFHTAVEINCRPERLDPPRPLLQMAVEYGCWFSIDTDAHATGQLEWQPHGCDRAAECEVPLEHRDQHDVCGRPAPVGSAGLSGRISGLCRRRPRRRRRSCAVPRPTTASAPTWGVADPSVPPAPATRQGERCRRHARRHRCRPLPLARRTERPRRPPPGCSRTICELARCSTAAVRQRWHQRLTELTSLPTVLRCVVRGDRLFVDERPPAPTSSCSRCVRPPIRMCRRECCSTRRRSRPTRRWRSTGSILRLTARSSRSG